MAPFTDAGAEGASGLAAASGSDSVSEAAAPAGWDTHMHLVPPAVVKAAGADRFGLATDGKSLAVDDARIPLGKIVDVDALLARVAADALQGGYVAIPPGLFRASQADSSRRHWAEFVNSAMAELVAAHPGQLRGLAFVPAEDPRLAAQLVLELEGDWAGVTFGTRLNGRRFHQPDFEPLWQALVERDLPVLLHPDHPNDSRLDDFYLTNLLGYPYETTVAAAHIVLGGVLERYPALRIILSHGGAATMALAGRWQRAAVMNRPGVPQLPLEPLDYLRRFYVDTVVHSALYLDFLIATLGSERIVLGSDWPFPMGTDSAAAGMDHLDPGTVRRFRLENVSRLFGSAG